MTSHTRAQIKAHFDAVKAYYEAQSGGREHLDHHVFDWVMLPLTGAEAAPLGFNAGDTVVPLFATASREDPSGFQHLPEKVNTGPLLLLGLSAVLLTYQAQRRRNA